MKEHTKIILLLLAIFILGFCIRGNLLQYNSLFEYDAFFHARMTADLILQGHVNNPDILAYYQVGGAPQTFTSPVWVLSAGIYQVLFGWNIGFDQGLFTKLMQFLPCLFGALICLVIYFVGKAASNGNKVIGLIAAFVAAVTPAFVYRTMAGAQIDNSFGFLPFSVGILFLILALKEKELSKKSVLFALISGLSFFFMVFAWSMYLIIPIILVAFWAFYAFNSLSKEENKKTDIASIVHFLIIFGLFNVGALLNHINWVTAVFAFSKVPEMIILIGTIISVVGGCLILFFRKEMSPDIKSAIKTIIPIVLFIIAIAMVYVTTLNIDFADRTTLGSMVGEEAVGNAFFLGKYNIFLLLIPLALFIPAILYFWKGEEYEFTPLFFIGFLLFFFMAWVKLKFTFTLGYGMIFAAILVAIFLYELYMKMKDNNKLETKIVFIPLIAILFCGIAASGVFILDYVPSLDGDPSLQQVIGFINTNTPQDAKLLNNWGMGHILSYETRRAVSADNRNYSPIANAQFARFENDTNTEEVYKMVIDMKTDYIILDKSDFYSLQPNAFYIANKISSLIGQEFTQPLIQIIECGRSGTTLNCNGNTIDQNQIPPGWSSIPAQFYSGKYPLYFYIYQDSLIVLNTAANNTNLAKVFANSSETSKYYTRAFESPKYLVLKVNK